MPPSRDLEPARKKRRQEDSRRKRQGKRRYRNHTNLDDLAAFKRSASTHLAQVRITKPVGSFRNIKESKRASRSEDGIFSKESLKRRVEQDLQSILSPSELRRPPSPGPSRRLPTLQDEYASSPGRSSFLTPIPHRKVVGDAWRTSGTRPEETAKTSTQRTLTEASRSDGDRKTSETEKDILAATVSKLHGVLAEKCRTLYRTTDILQSVRRFVQERCLEEETSDRSTIPESDSEGSAMSIDEPVEEDPRSVGGSTDGQHYAQPGSFPADVRSPSRSVASVDVLYGDQEWTRRPWANDRTQRDLPYEPPPPSPPPVRNTQARDRPRPPSSHCSTSREVEWIDLTESPPPPPSGMPPPRQHALYETSGRQQYDVMLPGYVSDVLSDEDLVPPSPPVQRHSRRLAQSNFYSPVDFKTESKGDLDEEWYYVPQKMF